MKTVLLDIDGVLVDFAGRYLQLLHDQTGRKHSVEEITSFDFHACVSSKQEDQVIWDYIAETPGLVRNLPMYPGAEEFLRELRTRARVVACTSPASARWTEERVRWLQCAGFAARDIAVVSNKALVHGDILVDDAVHNVCTWSARWPDEQAVLFRRPWNRGYTGTCTVVENYAQVLSLL